MCAVAIEVAHLPIKGASFYIDPSSIPVIPMVEGDLYRYTVATTLHLLSKIRAL